MLDIHRTVVAEDAVHVCEQIQDAFGRVPSNHEIGVKGWVYKKGDWKNPSFQKRYFVLSFDKLKG